MSRRRQDTIDPDTARELAALDAALAGEPGADPALTQLIADVRADAPRMSPPFAARLDERVAAGSRGRAFAPVRLLPWLTALRKRPRAALVPALGVAATMLAALVVVVALVGRGGEPARTPSVQDAGGRTAAPPAIPSAGGQTAAPTPARGKPAGTERGASEDRLLSPRRAARPGRPGFGRKHERLTQLTLSTPADDVQDVSDGVVRVTQSVGGFVESSQVTTNERTGAASFRLRVPAARLDEAVRRLSALAHVASLSQSATDITGAFVSAAGRLSDARAERRALLRALAKATTANEIASLRARLRLNASEISAYKGELNALRRRADLATVEVGVEGRGHSSGGGSWTPADALRDAARVLEVTAGVLLVGAAALAPLAVLGVLVGLTARSLRRRRREHALDAA